MKQIFIFLQPLLLGLILTGCDEIFSPDISQKQIQLISPEDSLYTSRSEVDFWWEEDGDIESYRIRVWELDRQNRIPVLDSSLIGKKADLNLSPNRLYEWQIRGENEGSESNWTEGWIAVDQESPEKAAALSLDGDTLTGNGPDTLRWQSGDLLIPGALQAYPVSDSVYLSARDDSTRFPYRAFFEEGSSRIWPVRNATVPLNGPGRFYWQVVSIDRAGNRSYSQLFHFDLP